MNAKNLLFMSLPLLLTINGCVFHRENILQDAEYRLLGKTKDELLACAGEPSSKRSREGKDNWVYTNGKPRTEPDSCKLTFIFVDGKVSKFDFVGDLTGLKSSANTCYQVVRDCW